MHINISITNIYAKDTYIEMRECLKRASGHKNYFEEGYDLVMSL